MACAGVGTDGGGGDGRHRSRHGGGCDQSVHGGCDGAQMVSVSLGESHKHGHTKSHEVSQIRSIEVAKRVVQWLLVVVVQGGRIVMVLISTYQHSFSTEKQCRRCLCGTPIWDVRTGQQLQRKLRNLVATFQTMQVAPPDDQILNQSKLCQICNYYKWRHLVAKFATNASGAIWWPNLQLMQVAPSGGQICN